MTTKTDNVRAIVLSVATRDRVEYNGAHYTVTDVIQGHASRSICLHPDDPKACERTLVAPFDQRFVTAATVWPLRRHAFPRNEAIKSLRVL